WAFGGCLRGTELGVMEAWRQKAFELLPELDQEIVDAGSPMSLWIEVRLLLDEAYGADHTDDSLLGRIYSYARWCLEQEQDPGASPSDDLTTCVVVCLYEDLPSHERAFADMHRWFTRDAIVTNADLWLRLMS